MGHETNCKINKGQVKTYIYMSTTIIIVAIIHMAVITVAIITPWLFSCGYYAVAIITVAIFACFDCSIAYCMESTLRCEPTILL